MEQGNVSKAIPRALSNRMVLDPLRTHCSTVSSNIKALRDTGTSVVPAWNISTVEIRFNESRFNDKLRFNDLFAADQM